MNLPIHLKELQLIIVGCILLAALALLQLRANAKRKKQQEKLQTYTPPQRSTHVLSSKDIEMVAGEDVITTQLDLARAYLEMGKNNLAKSILFHVSKQGRPEQQQEARELINSL